MRLIKGDCLQVMDELIAEGVKVDCITTDLPFGTTNSTWDTIIPFDKMWLRINKLIKPNGAVVLFGAEPFSSALRMSNLKNYKYDWTYQKTVPTMHLNAKKQPLRVIENIMVFYSKQCLYNPQKTYGHPRKVSTAHAKRNVKKTEAYGDYKATDYDSTERYPINLQKFAPDRQKVVYHTNQKPVALLKYLVSTYTLEGDTVLDFAMGSGTTGVACENLGRDFIGIELKGRYFRTARRRIIK